MMQDVTRVLRAPLARSALRRHAPTPSAGGIACRALGLSTTTGPDGEHRLRDGRTLPWIGLGTFGSDWQPPEKIAGAVAMAMDKGYRHFDCAPAYQNHREVGAALREGMERNGLTRDDLFITSKLGNDGHSDVRAHLTQTLEELGLDHLDMYLIHWPWPNFHPPGCDADYINPDSRPYIHAKYMETYGEIEKAHDDALVRYPGVSNLTLPKMKLVMRDARIKPTVNQIEVHPHFQQAPLVEYCLSVGVIPVGYMPLGSPNRPARDVFPEHTVDLEDPVLKEVASAHGITVGQAALKLNLQRRVPLIPQTATPARLDENLAAATLPDFSAEEMARLRGIDKNCRLIHGQVFCWKQGQDWHDLWDDTGDERWEGPINGACAAETPAE